MKTKITFEFNGEYLKAKIAGKWVYEELAPGFEYIKAEADRCDVKKLLLDAVELSYPTNDMIRFYTGAEIANIFKHQYKISAFTALKVNHYTETVALNRGIRFRIFPNEEEAVDWLVGEKY